MNEKLFSHYPLIVRIRIDFEHDNTRPCAVKIGRVVDFPPWNLR